MASTIFIGSLNHLRTLARLAGACPLMVGPIGHTCSIVALCLFAIVPSQTRGEDVHFRQITLSEEFQCEGANVGDIDSDGHLDIVAGPYWYAGPDFRQRHAYMAAAASERHAIAGYSDHFFSWCEDIDGDKRLDIVVVGMPGEAAYWFENPAALRGDADGTAPGIGAIAWKRHLIGEDVGGESPAFIDWNGDGTRELICVHGGRFGWLQQQAGAPHKPWSFHSISSQDGLGRFTHGMGIGDVDGDGRLDLLETRGWWRRQPNDSYELQEFRFAESGGAQMHVYDFDGDGDNDVVSCQNAHGWGLKWFERRGRGDDVLFVPHAILSDKPEEHPDGAAISQLHALALADIDGDGVKDLVTGKRYWAHGGKDPGAQQLAVLYWFRTVRSESGVHFEAHRIADRVGVGTQLVVTDVDGDQRVDLVVGNKLGAFVMLQSDTPQGPADAPDAAKRASSLSVVGTDLFHSHIRESEPMTAEKQGRLFVAPPGFKVELVASEPAIAKPLNMAFDDRGRLWVTSTLEYPVPVPIGSKGRDSIKVLEDTTGDGRYDKTTTFAEGLNIPMGLYPIDDGVICFDIPNVVRLDDTNGDGIADRRTKLYGPFDTTRDTHGMCNAFTRGSDGWLYACHGFNNHSKVAGADQSQVEMRSGNVFRMRLDGSRIEHFGHGQVNPFGLAIDNYGDVLTADCHTKPINLVMQGGYHDSFGAPHDGLGYVPNVLEHLHGSTGIGGIALGESLAFPPLYQLSTFGGNVVTGRINRNTLSRGERVSAMEEPDFVVCGDSWFRPVDLQAGPDGALYIADFYNRIIGHYEVKLDHPGRDRHRGRIWRVVYEGDDGRRDVEALPSSGAYESDLKQSPQALWERLSDTTPELRTRIVNRLVDVFPNEARLLAQSHFHEAASSNAWSENGTIAAMWVLARLGGLTREELNRQLESSSGLVRNHVFRIIEALGSQQAELKLTKRQLSIGLADPSPQVRRVAALASATIVDEGFVKPLFAALRKHPAANSHVRHAIRMSLKRQLGNEDAFAQVAASKDPGDHVVLADLAIALKSTIAGDYVARRFDQLPLDDPARLLELAEFAARYASPDAAAGLALTLQAKLSNDVAAQLRLLRSVDDGVRQRGARPPAVRDWALALARRLTELAGKRSTSLRWTAQPVGDTAENQPCWDVSDRRSCADGVKGAAMFSSFPHGEQRTGAYRSEPFALDAQLSFYIAGHDGVPDQPINGKNFVQLRLSADHRVLYRTPPPRNDTAQLIVWDTAKTKGQRAYVELIDGDTAGAFAWLAVGRFSDARLNPTRQSNYQRDAARLVRDFGLQELRGVMTQMLREDVRDIEAATTVAVLRGGGVLRSVAEALAISSLSTELRQQLVDQLTGEQGDAAPLLTAAMKTASKSEQQSVALQLATDDTGRTMLLDLVKAGHANARLLLEPAIGQRMESGSAEQKKRRSEMLKGVAVEAPAIAETIARRIEHYRSTPGSREPGKLLFSKRCAVCHQVAGEGKKVGPNLDGIGTRGLARLMEDVTAPNRNVDAAFRSTIIVTDDGEVISGAMKPDQGGELVVLVNAKGEELRISKSDIAQQKRSPLSPMPENLSQDISDAEFRDLMAYLLSLR